MAISNKTWSSIEKSFQDLYGLEKIFKSTAFRVAVSKLDESLAIRKSANKNLRAFFKNEGVVFNPGVKVALTPDNWSLCFKSKKVNACLKKTDKKTTLEITILT